MDAIDELKGKPITVVFATPHPHGKVSVQSVSGACGGGWHPGPLVVNNISEALDPQGNDVTNTAGLAGKTLIMNTAGIAYLVGE